MSSPAQGVRFFDICPSEELAQYNLKIFNLLKSGKTVSINEISGLVHIPENIVSTYIDSCVKRDLMKITIKDQKSLIDFNDNGRKMLGIGFSGKEIYLTVIGINGEIVKSEGIKIRSFKDILSKDKKRGVKEIAERVRESSELKNFEFLCLGAALPIGLDHRVFEIFSEEIGNIFKCRVLSASEITAAAYGEKDYTKNEKSDDVLYMYSDVGAGTVIRGETIFEDGESTSAGGREYLRPWNQFSIVEAAKSLVEKGVGTSIVNKAEGSVENITMEVVLEAARDHDELAGDIVKRSGLALGVRVAYLIELFGADRVILGGGVEASKDIFCRHVAESAKKFEPGEKGKWPEIVPATIGKEVSSLGAASLCRRQIFMEV